jgi:DNA-binding NtrC family response regulator
MTSSDEDDDVVVTELQRAAASVDATAYRLTIVEGPDAGRTFDLDGRLPARVLVGQSPACDIRLSDRHVSRRHAELDLGGAHVRIVDLESTNGTTVNGVAILGALLRGGEVVRLGETAFRLDALEKRRVPMSTATHFGRVVGSSVEMRRLYPHCERLARSDVPVLIEGETGTGKEALAEALHEASARAAGPFVVFDCTAVAPNLVESELFGHERGAFTGAVSQRRGVFEQAQGGTLLIDEIGDLDLALQPKLLRAIERSEIRRVGSDRVLKVDVRVLAATRRDLDKEIQDGRFRDDLFFRIAVARIELPPLRERRGDIGVLAAHFWRELGGGESIPPELLQRFEHYAWPGNIRELANTVARHLALGELVEPELAPAGGAKPRSSDAIEDILALDLPFPRARQRVLADFERRYVERVLARYGGSVQRAAEASGIARRYFNVIAARHQNRK